MLQDARMVRSRAALREALLSLLETTGYDKITVRDITARAPTGYATFFRHYDTKAALLHDVAANQIGQLIQQALPILLSVDSRGAARALCRYVDERRKLWSALLFGGAAGIMREEFIRQVRQIPPLESSSSQWLPNDLKIIYGVCSTVEILAWWLQKPAGFSVDHVAEILDRLVIAPMMAPD